MIKKCMLFLAFVSVIGQGFAQSEDEGNFKNFYLTGSMSLRGTDYDIAERNQFSIFVGPGYRISEQVVVGVQLMYSKFEMKYDLYGDQLYPGQNQDIEQFGFGLFSRQNFEIANKLSFVAQEGFMMLEDSEDNSAFKFNITPMLNYQVTNTIGVDINFGGFNYITQDEKDQTDYELNVNLQNVQLGVNIMF